MAANAPSFEGLHSVRETLSALAECDIRIEGAPDDFIAERILDIKILSQDQAGTEDVRLLINLSGYTPLVLAD